MSAIPTFTPLGQEPPNRSMLEDQYVPAADNFAAWMPTIADEMGLALVWTAEQLSSIELMKNQSLDEIGAAKTGALDDLGEVIDGAVSTIGQAVEAAEGFSSTAGNEATVSGEYAAESQQWATSLAEVSGGLKGARGYADDAKNDANRAEAAASSLPDGTINNSIVSDADTWSSAYLNRLIVDWVDITASTVLAAKTNYAAYFAAGPLTLTLPATPTANDFVQIYAADGDATGSTIARNGQTIMGLAEDLTLDYPVTWLRLVFSGTDWRIAV